MPFAQQAQASAVLLQQPQAAPGLQAQAVLALPQQAQLHALFDLPQQAQEVVGLKAFMAGYSGRDQGTLTGEIRRRCRAGSWLGPLSL